MSVLELLLIAVCAFGFYKVTKIRRQKKQAEQKPAEPKAVMDTSLVEKEVMERLYRRILADETVTEVQMVPPRRKRKIVLEQAVEDEISESEESREEDY